VDGESLVVLHHGEPTTLTAGTPVDRRLPHAPVRPEPQQPLGRRPVGLPTEEEERAATQE
jgi:alpha,alpha-trehalose phosphorylase